MEPSNLSPAHMELEDHMKGEDVKEEMDEQEQKEVPNAEMKQEEEQIEAKKEMASIEWTEGLIPEATDLDQWKDHVIEVLKQLLVKFGCARNYLEQRYKDQSEALAFYDYVQNLSESEHPMQNLFDSKSWSEKQSNEMLKLPPWCFSFAAGCSMKPDADQSHTLELARMILTHGFESQMDPLMVTLRPAVLQTCPCPVQPSDRVQPFTVGFCKGKARMHSLLTILSICHDNKLNLAEVAWLGF